MNIRPLGDRVLIRPDKTEDIVEGIVRPDISQETPSQGEVLAIGDGYWDHPITVPVEFGNQIIEGKGPRPLSVKVGDHVAYGKYSGTALDIDGEKMLIMREDEILAIVPAESKVALS